MRRADFLKVQDLMLERHRCENELRAKLGVTLGGTYQNDALVDAVRPVVHGILKAAIAEIDKKLAALGVTG